MEAVTASASIGSSRSLRWLCPRQSGAADRYGGYVRLNREQRIDAVAASVPFGREGSLW